MPVETFPWEIQEHLGTAEGQLSYLQAALEDGDPTLITVALSDVARARGMSAVLEEAGLAREPHERATNLGDPQFSAVMRIVKALGLRFAVTAVEPRTMEPA